MGRSEIRGGQIKDDSITGDDVDESTLILDTLRDADGDTKVQLEESADEDKIRFDTSGTERVIISDARVQLKDQLVVGAVNASTWVSAPPSADALHIQDGVTVLQTNAADAFGSMLALQKSRNATDGSHAVVQDGDMLGYIHFLGDDGTNYEEAACIAAYVDGTPGSNDMPGCLKFSTTSDGTNEVIDRMVIRESGLVGIGTDDPDNTLHIKSGGDTHLKIESDGGSYPALKMKSGTAGSTYVWTPADTSDIRLYAGGADRVHVDNTGNVGIGTTTPTCTLSVAGSYAANVTGINASNDPGTTYSVAVTDHILLINTRPTNQGGIDSAITITLPAAASFAGRVLTFKDAAGYADINGITIQRAGNDTIDGIETSMAIPQPAAWFTFVSDGVSSWFEIS
jgi:hypothetical protein